MKVHIITHTHWDREWYVSNQLLRHRLINMMDSFLNEIENEKDFKYFMLDGQLIVLEDYLELRPEKKDLLLNMIRNGKIIIGPWYILPDEFLISGEALIRNFLYAKKICENYDIKYMNIGYLPDMFGHSAYTPSILKGLDFKSAVIWRGVGEKCRKTEFEWYSENGDFINTINLYRGYFNLAKSGTTFEDFYKKLNYEINEISKNNTSDNILLMNGIDHEIPDFKIKKIFSKNIIHSTLENYSDEVFKHKKKFKKVYGELKSPLYEPILKDISSSRIYLKLLNHESQILYERYIEPLNIIAIKKYKKNFENEINYGWKELLKSQAHDSIGGCSTDSVGKEVEVRLKNSFDNARSTLSRILNNFIDDSKNKNYINIINMSEYENNDIYEFYLDNNKDDYELYQKNEKIPCIIEKSQKILNIMDKSENTVGGNNYIKEINQLNSYLTDKSIIPFLEKCVKKITFSLKLKPFEIITLELKKSQKISTHKKNINNATFENKFIKFKLNEDLSFDIEDKIKNTNYNNLNTFFYSKDIGDEYNYDYGGKELKVNPKIKSLKIKENENMKIIECKSDFKNSPITIIYKLSKNLKGVNIYLNIKNKQKNNRFRSSFKISKNNLIYNDGYYGLVEHKTKLNNNIKFNNNGPYKLNKDTSAEEIIPRYTMNKFVTDKKIQIITRGLYEYEIIENEIYLTLLRSVDSLSKKNISTRQIEAGPNLKTEDSQIIRSINLEYAFRIIENEKELFKNSSTYSLHPIILNNSKIIEDKLFDLPNDITIYALKIINNNDYLIRFVNHNKTKTIKFDDKYNIYFSNMREDKIKIISNVLKVEKNKIYNIIISEK
ncbi:alpha-mannosidase/mannosylglycerate hydrolase [Oceanotoga teriensis]|uniref:Alpha-mannosidase/mannosylglycerate hydrolase n=1 Tax=Oceanotoga teriensis TaxID=515440 RepID=A0AA45C6L9_9BACT|nr:hypothetical protein [Oceanotoga teriensis]PWJ92086.1 alpha-mannosidase/mannosylglycerate hydrolase [Oceanotoga teriensis]